jgi:shikimate kinase/3-dehydroquinate synthase
MPDSSLDAHVREALPRRPALTRPLILSGFMGTGKSTVGRRLARRLGVAFVDSDSVLEEQTGMRAADLLRHEGEARFRELEAACALSLLEDLRPRVIAFGGGTVTNRRVRHRALEVGTVVTLRASADCILKRISRRSSRPNLAAEDPLQRAKNLLEARAEAYAECHATICTEELSFEEAADEALKVAGHDALVMPLGSRSYVVDFADGPLRLQEVLRRLAPSSLLVVTDRNVAEARGAWLASTLSDWGEAVPTVTLTPGEPTKNILAVTSIWDAALASKMDRGGVLLAVGGGVVGDLAGFAASTLLRGVRCVQVPTSLLAMVDSSVGGKTGFDHPLGKNLIGSFFQPSHVLVDVDHLTTLPERERRAGLAEIVKIALVADASLLDALESDVEALASGELESIRRIVRASVAAKIRLVRDDERDLGVRALLNLGHTVGHALEVHGGYSRWLHGEAIAIGTVLELAALESLGFAVAGISARAAHLLAALGLPTRVSHDDVIASAAHFSSDKKRKGRELDLPTVRECAGKGEVIRIGLTAFRDSVLAASLKLSA